jgi:putative hydrolase of the HAD superfamily
MYTPKAIGFDLFNTLITIHPEALKEAHQKLVDVLNEEGLPVEAAPFGHAYVEAAKGFLQEAHKDGRETHNRYWIAAALESNGYCLNPADARIAKVVEAYFSTFYPHCQLVPGTKEILGQLAEKYRLGLLTNFTHPPAALKIIDMLGLSPFFHTVLVSGELGYDRHRAVLYCCGQRCRQQSHSQCR